MLKNPSPLKGTSAYRFVVTADRPLKLLRSCPAYEATPLVELQDPAGKLNVARLWAKDETQRMRLGSFKALGGAYAVAQIIADRTDGSDTESDEFRRVASSLTFITASAGNHGLSVAAGARIFGARSVIVLPATVPEAFAARIRRTGGEVTRVNGDYEDSVAYAEAAARKNDWLLLADGSWEGYLGPPSMVMEGYTVLAEECRQSFEQIGEWPTHVFLQAGVGGLAASFAAHVRTSWPAKCEIVVVEPDAAPCLMASIEKGRLERVEGPESNMARLDCKQASLIAFEALSNDADCFTTVSDDQAKQAAGLLSSAGLATTPSGAAGMAALREFPLPANSRCLIVVTEGPEDGGSKTSARQPSTDTTGET